MKLVIYLDKENIFYAEGKSLEKVEGPLPPADNVLVVESVLARPYYADKKQLSHLLQSDLAGDRYISYPEDIAPGKIQVYSVKQDVVRAIREFHRGPISPYYMAVKEFRKKEVEGKGVDLFVELIGPRVLMTCFYKEEITSVRIIPYDPEDIQKEVDRTITGGSGHAGAEEEVTIYSNIDVTSTLPYVKKIKRLEGYPSIAGAQYLPKEGLFFLPEEIKRIQREKEAAKYKSRLLVAATGLGISVLLFLFMLTSIAIQNREKEKLYRDKEYIERKIQEEFSTRAGSFIYGRDIPSIQKACSILQKIPPLFTVYSFKLDSNTSEIVTGPEEPVYFTELGDIKEDNIEIMPLISQKPSFKIVYHHKERRAQ